MRVCKVLLVLALTILVTTDGGSFIPTNASATTAATNPTPVTGVGRNATVQSSPVYNTSHSRTVTENATMSTAVSQTPAVTTQPSLNTTDGTKSPTESTLQTRTTINDTSAPVTKSMGRTATKDRHQTTMQTSMLTIIPPSRTTTEVAVGSTPHSPIPSDATPPPTTSTVQVAHAEATSPMSLTSPYPPLSLFTALLLLLLRLLLLNYWYEPL
ncbi:unnamed protein product [Hydatigera taeniaeformis]|uniref:Mucin-5AC-like n=1 Tax=Hydatigena taeniaeformis TaxID=6205 RepID=A0A0R3WMX7_HYDTA|nr:unnamed protein product [Hydatigera taeniaeformis]